MTTDELANRVEAGFDENTVKLWEMYQSLPPEIKDAIDGVIIHDKQQRERVAALEAFVGKWAAFEFAEITMSEEVWEMQHEARALLAGSEGGDGQR